LPDGTAAECSDKGMFGVVLAQVLVHLMLGLGEDFGGDVDEIVPFGSFTLDLQMGDTPHLERANVAFAEFVSCGDEESTAFVGHSFGQHHAGLCLIDGYESHGSCPVNPVTGVECSVFSEHEFRRALLVS